MWQCVWEQVGNMRVGFAECTTRFSQSCALFDNRGFGGVVWYVDYNGDVWKTTARHSVRIGSLGCCVSPGDTMTFVLDMDQGNFRIAIKGSLDSGAFCAQLSLGGPVTPVYSLCHQGESIRLLAGRSEHAYTVSYNEPLSLIKPKHAGNASGTWIGTAFDPRVF